jgi:ParB-like chromosome segregation protein Spo0J
VTVAENAFRKDLTPAEEGLYYAELIQKFDLTEDQLLQMVRQKPNYVYERLNLVGGDREVLRALLDRKINFAVAKELNKCEDPKQRGVWLDMAVRGGATAAIVRQWVATSPDPSATEGTAEVGSTPTASTSQDVEPAMRCALCGGYQDPQNLRIVYLHFYEIASIIHILERNGVDVDRWKKVLE